MTSAQTLDEDVLLLIIQTVGTQADAHVYLSHVCHYWRVIALGAATLWTKIILSVKANSEGFQKQEEWIRRSSQALLDIHIHEDGGMKDKTSTHMDEIISFLRPHARRWKTLKVDTVRQDWVTTFWTELEGVDVPELVDLTLMYARADVPRIIYPFRGGKMPRLKQMVFRSTLRALDWEFTTTLTGLTVLELHEKCLRPEVENAVEDILDLMRRSPELVSFTVLGESSNLVHPPPFRRPKNVLCSTSITEFNVHSLNLRSALLPHLQLLSLTHLPQYVQPELLPLVHEYGPFPNLTTITIDRPWGDPWDRIMSALPPLLSRLESLETLTVRRFNAAGLVDKTWIQGFSKILPNLKMLNVDWDSGMSEESVRALIEGRKEWGKPLKEFKLEVPFVLELSDDWIAWMTNNVEELKIVRKPDDESDDDMAFGVFD